MISTSGFELAPRPSSLSIMKSYRPPQIRNRKFTPLEDERIIQYVTDNGGSCTHVQWLSLDEELGRQNLSAQLRWTNVLKPRLRAALADQSSAILAGLHSGGGSSVPLDLPPSELITTLQYKRHPFTAPENERILQFALERTMSRPHTPWTRLDEELGRNGGACKHRYETLVAREAKDVLKSMVGDVEKVTPTARQRADQLGLPRKPRRKAPLAYTDPNTAPMSAEMTQELTRVTDYTPEEDALITTAVYESPGGHMTSARWRALAAHMDRPESWLRYRWAILARKEEKAQAMQSAVLSALYEVPVQRDLAKEMLSLVDAVVEAVCDTQQRFAAVTPRAGSAPSGAPSSSSSSIQKPHRLSVAALPCGGSNVITPNAAAAPNVSSALTAKAAASDAPRTYTRAELMHVTVQMAKCQAVGEDIWKAVSTSTRLSVNDMKIIKLY